MSLVSHVDMSGKTDPEPIRNGFGRGLLEAGKNDESIVALCADLTDSTRISYFKEEFPDRFIQAGICEQNMALLSAGLANVGKIPFSSSYAAFHPGRSFDQIRTAICMGELPVKIVGSHAGVSVGPDGGTHQMLEDVALMRSLPHMVVVCPGDAIEAEKATQAVAKDKDHPAYIRLAREATPVFTTKDSPFDIEQAHVFRKGSDITLVGTGTMTYHLLAAAEKLAGDGIDAEVVHVPVVKPLDAATIVASATKTGLVVTAEEGQAAAGFGSAILEALSEDHPIPVKRIGVRDRFGESGTPDELMEHFGLDTDSVYQTVKEFYNSKKG
jgi:transketolase